MGAEYKPLVLVLFPMGEESCAGKGSRKRGRSRLVVTAIYDVGRSCSSGSLEAAVQAAQGAARATGARRDPGKETATIELAERQRQKLSKPAPVVIGPQSRKGVRPGRTERSTPACARSSTRRNQRQILFGKTEEDKGVGSRSLDEKPKTTAPDRCFRHSGQPTHRRWCARSKTAPPPMRPRQAAARPASHGTDPVRRVSGQEAQLLMVSPGTAARSASMVTTVQLPKVSAMAAIFLSF
jgi:hypothetical protein